MLTVLQSNIIDQVIDSDGTFIATRFPFFGNTTFYSFSDTIDSKVTSMTIQGTYTEAINQKLFVVPSLSFVNPGAGPKYLVRAAVSPLSLGIELKLTSVAIDLPSSRRNNVDSYPILCCSASRLNLACI